VHGEVLITGNDILGMADAQADFHVDADINRPKQPLVPAQPGRMSINVKRQDCRDRIGTIMNGAVLKDSHLMCQEPITEPWSVAFLR